MSMRKISLLILFAFPCFLSAQTVFWTENFTSGGSGWNLSVVTGPEGANPNFFNVSDDEGGNITPNMGAPGSCGVAGNGDNTMHVTSVFNPSGGASYDAGGLCGILFCPQTNRRAESPVINCSGNSNISVNFAYIENGQTTLDDATLWYYNGTVWAQADNMPKTLTGCGGQGLWTTRTVALPISANNNSNVKIAFRWVNNDDGAGTDPSFAVDNITLVGTTATPPPVSAFTPSATTVCVGVPVTFTDNSTNTPTSWAWTFQGGTPANASTQNPGSVTFSTVGAHTVTLVASNGGGAGTTATQVINVTAAPSVGASATPNPVCSGTPVSVSATGASSYIWSPGGLTGSTITLTLGSTATYTVTGTSNGCSSTASVTITVNQLPTVSFSGLSGPYCTTSSPVNLSGNPSGGTFSGNGITGNSFAPNAAQAGTHSISYSYTDGNGCSRTSSQTVVVNAPPNVSIMGLDPVYCINSANVTMNGAPSGGIFSGQGVAGTQFSPTVAGMGQHLISYTYGPSGCQATANQSVNIVGLPVVSFNLTIDSLCTTAAAITLTGGSPAPGQYSGAGVSSGLFNPALTGPSAGIYIVSYEHTDGNGCKNTAQDQIVLWVCPVVSVDPGFTGFVTVYPNPGTGNFIVQSDVNGNCKVVDMNGRLVKEFELKTGMNALDITESATGVYLLHLETAKGTKVVKLEKY